MLSSVYWRRGRRRAVAPIIATIFLLGMTIASGVVIWSFSIKPAPPLPKVYVQAQGGLTYPVWGDPTDCRPNLPNNTAYWLGNGSSNPRYSTYMTAWYNDCEYNNTGVYNMMNVSVLSIQSVSQPIPLADVNFEFICHNDTPAPITTTLVGGSLQSMSWFPGSSQTLPSNAPTLGSCGSFNVSAAYPNMANGVYYNRLGFYDPLRNGASLLTPGDAFILYVHTPNSVYEEPSPLEGQREWNLPDIDDFHGAPTWCFNTVGACTIYLVDTAIAPNSVLATIPVTELA